MNILIPIASHNPLFKEDEFAFPKPLIDILGKPMIEHTLSCFKNVKDIRFTFVVPDEFCKAFSLDNILKVITEGYQCNIVKLRKPTQGAVCSCLLAIDSINPEEELIISNSDHVIRANLKQIFSSFQSDVGLVTFDSTHPRWSYVSSDENANIIETSEKRVISRQAIAGLYYFKRGADFIDASLNTIMNGVTVNDAYYISQVVNELILKNKQVTQHNIPSSSYFNLYSPQKVSEYEKILRDERISRGHIDDRPVLIIPAAGEGSRFANAGYEKPKPFIDVNGKPMIRHVLDNLQHSYMRSIVIARSSHLSEQEEEIQWWETHGIHCVPINNLTEGTACTVLLAQHYIDPDAPLIIANSDQLVDFNIRDFLRDCLARNLDGSILCFRDSERNPKWSFAKTNPEGYVTEVKEKVAISDLATVGIYLFTKGSTFLDACIDMIAHNDRVNGEFYVCPVYNYAISNGAKIGVYEIGEDAMSGLGTPEDLSQYLEKNK